MEVEERKVYRAEGWPIGPIATGYRFGSPVLVSVGYENRAPCGCMIVEGMRMDRPGPRGLAGEPVVGFRACDTDGHREAFEKLADDWYAKLVSGDNAADDTPLHDVIVGMMRGLEL